MEFHDTIPTDFQVDSSLQAEPEQAFPVEFTASGSEYFRIWIVNLLLTILTLTLYTPFARARRLVYFYGNTRVAGHALGFHGNPWKMLRGYLLVMVLGLAYAVTTNVAPLLAPVAMLLFAAVWPALWRSSLQFRLANTSWRGLRFRFEGDLKGAYLAMAPVYLPSIALVTVMSLVMPKPGSPEAELPPAPPALFWLLLLLFWGLMPLSLALIKRYQHNGYRYANEVARLDLGLGAFYWLALKIVGIVLGLFAVAAIPLGLAAAGGAFGRGSGMGAGAMVAMVLSAIAFFVAYLMMFAVVGPYATSRTQNMVWGGTASRRLRFASDLRFVPYVQLTAVNFLLTMFTFGLYKPFATVTNAKMRLKAMTVHVRGDVDHWVSAAGQAGAGTTGDAAGDFFGIDLGL
jgi:uncharacterized membrane protein YjgN (DUF898 family)